jgi:hypothetical protein
LVELNKCPDFSAKKGWGYNDEEGGAYMRLADERKMSPLYTHEQRLAAEKAVNNIATFIYNGNYGEGCRNNTMVDLACACHVLDIDPYDAVLDAGKGKLDADEQSWCYRKLRTIQEYLPGWDQAADGVFGYMFDEWQDEEPEWAFVKLV